jgi:predicted RNA-binding Zn-ribbon protein involved in translation (DUF1610 family)
VAHDMPFQFRLPRQHTLKLRVPKKKVNVFLSILWDELTARFERMVCAHYYRPTNDSELYIYTADWSDPVQDFEAQLNFFNHTSRGLVMLKLAVVDKHTGKENANVTNDILLIATQTQERALREQKRKPSSIAHVPVTTSSPLNGFYDLSDCTITPLEKQENFGIGRGRFVSTLSFTVFTNALQERIAEAIDKSRVVTASLSVLTQNLFLAEYTGITFSEISTISNTTVSNEEMQFGLFVPDDGLISDQIQPDVNGVFYFTDDQSVTKDIVESRDVMINDTIALPMRADTALKYITNNPDIIQSVCRFQEGLIFQQEMIYNPNRVSLGDILTPYQLVAFVAAIEALLDTSPVDVKFECPSCGEEITIKERRINKAFQAFVAEQSGNNPVFEEIFKDIYNDRSKFVHTGKDLFNRTAIRPNRPLILNGKDIVQYQPRYHFNMPDYVGWLIRRYIYKSAFFDQTL